MARVACAVLVLVSLAASGAAQGIQQQAYLKAFNSDQSDRFGNALAVSGDTVVVGAPREAGSGTGVDPVENNDADFAGAAYVYVRNGATWTLDAYLKASNTDVFDLFSVSVAVDGDTIAVGAPFEASNATGVNGDASDNSMAGSGAVYVFVRDGAGNWSQQAYVKASNSGQSDQFGTTVALSGDTLVVGSIGEDSVATGVNGDQSSNGNTNSGAAYVFTRSGATWTQEAYLKASNTGFEDQFGSAVKIDGDTVLVGALSEDSGATGIDGDGSDNSQTDSGAVYVFTRSGTAWSQEAYVKASNTDAEDSFGWRCDISGDTLVAGAHLEDSAATGINGDQGDESATRSGAAYVFTRSGSIWSQQAYLKASNAEEWDEFGFGVSIGENTIVVGAPGEDSAASGHGGDASDNTLPTSGAAYVFTRNGTTWTQHAYLKATPSSSFDDFGQRVDLDRDLALIGAPGEDSDSNGVNSTPDETASGAGAAYAIEMSGWQDLGGATAGALGDPTLDGTGLLVGGTSGHLDLSNVPPGAFCAQFQATSSTPVPFYGGILVAFPFFTLVPLTSSPSGEIPLPFVFPTGVPAGIEIWVQYGVVDPTAPFGISISNAMKGVTQ